MSKSADAFRTISEVADWLGVHAHVLRFWESKFTQIKPVKRAGGRRYYRPADMQLLGGIQKLLHDDGLTIKGVQKILREKGIAHVSDMSKELDEENAEPAGTKTAPRAVATPPIAPRAPEAPSAMDVPASDEKDENVVNFMSGDSSDNDADDAKAAPARPSFTEDAVIRPEPVTPEPKMQAPEPVEAAKAPDPEPVQSDPEPDEVEEQVSAPPQASEPTPEAENAGPEGAATSEPVELDTATPDAPESVPTPEIKDTMPEVAATSESVDEVVPDAPAPDLPDPVAAEPEVHDDADNATDVEPKIEAEAEAEAEEPSIPAFTRARRSIPLDEAPEVAVTEAEIDDTPAAPVLPSFLHRPALGNAPEPINAQVEEEAAVEDEVEEPVQVAEPQEPPAEPAPEPEPPKPLIIDVPETLDEANFDAAPSLLSALTKTNALSRAQSKDISPLLAQLVTLRDRMVQARKE